MTDPELKALECEASKVIDIAAFVPLPQVDPVYFERTYCRGGAGGECGGTGCTFSPEGDIMLTSLL